jgi:hypothetical protein
MQKLTEHEYLGQFFAKCPHTVHVKHRLSLPKTPLPQYWTRSTPLASGQFDFPPDAAKPTISQSALIFAKFNPNLLILTVYSIFRVLSGLPCHRIGLIRWCRPVVTSTSHLTVLNTQFRKVRISSPTLIPNSLFSLSTVSLESSEDSPATNLLAFDGSSSCYDGFARTFLQEAKLI